MSQEQIQFVVDMVYLLSASLFIFGLKEMSSPKTARRGNILGGLGMLLAIVVTLFDREILSFAWIIVGILVGGLVGGALAYVVKMTAMPQMVAVFNGFGGASSALVAAADYLRAGGQQMPINLAVSILLTTLIGAVTFSGSMIAYGKLEGLVASRPVVYRGDKLVSVAIALLIIGIGIYLAASPGHGTLFLVLNIICLALGVLLVIPIGGADMPVVISLLNSYSGLAAATAGFVLNNRVLIVSGALVGASGIILTKIMCKAMNRSLANVLFGAFGQAASSSGGAQAGEGKSVRRYGADDAALLMSSARKVIVAPGYGLAVAQAQHALREMGNLLEKQGVEVKYAIHPVAGRMPGHMNVLLAEADVPYDRLFEMDEINHEFEDADVALIVGANDVVNPAARNDPTSPIYGMPILNVDKARAALVIKRSLASGFAGIDNPLFYEEKTAMVFGDAKQVLSDIAAELKQI